VSTVSNSCSIAPNYTLQSTFLDLVPRIQTHGQVVFRFLKCPHKRADAIAEMVALCWSWFIRLVERGKDPTQFPTTLADFAARAVRSGRRLAGMERSRDVLSPRAQQRFCFAVEPYPSSTASCFDDLYGTVHGQRNQDVWEERLQDNTRTPVIDQVAFRIDFPTWLATQTERNVRIAEAMIRGERTLDLARRFGLSPGRVSQIRQQLYQDYQRFHGEGTETARA
jgi:hypothetical protein